MAAAETVFEIGLDNAARSEFFDGAAPDGPALIPNCPVGSGTFIVGTDADDTYPGFHRNSNAGTTFFDFSCPQVTIQYSLGGDGEPLACANVEITYDRFGAEDEDIFLDGVKIGEANGVQTNVENNFSYSPSGIQLPGTHEIRVDPQPSSDGWAAVDYWKLSCDALVAFAKVSGRIGTTGKGNEPKWTVRGIVGELEDGAAVGSVDVNYKMLGEVCTFTPTEGSTISFAQVPSAFLGDWSNSCTGDTSNLRIVDKSAAPQGGSGYFCLNTSNRGCFGVDAPPTYRVSDGDNNASLEKGNGIVMD